MNRVFYAPMVTNRFGKKFRFLFKVGNIISTSGCYFVVFDNIRDDNADSSQSRPFRIHGDFFQIISCQTPANLMATVVCIVAAVKIKLGTVQFLPAIPGPNKVHYLK